MTDKPAVNRSIQLVGTPDLGKSILDQATEAASKAAKEKVLLYAADLMEKAEMARKFSDSLDADLAAIEAGEFTVTKSGHIVFSDPKRGHATAFGRNAVNCPRCGTAV